MIEVLTLVGEKIQQSSVEFQNIPVEQEQAMVDCLALVEDFSVGFELGQNAADLCKHFYDFSEGRSERTSHLRFIDHQKISF